MNPDAAAAAKTRRGRLAAITNDFATALQTRPRQRGREGDPGKIDYIEQNNSRSKLGIGGKQETSVQHTVGTRQNRSTDSLGVASSPPPRPPSLRSASRSLARWSLYSYGGGVNGNIARQNSFGRRERNERKETWEL